MFTKFYYYVNFVQKNTDKVYKTVSILEELVMMIFFSDGSRSLFAFSKKSPRASSSSLNVNI